MLVGAASGPEGRWGRARVLLRLAGLAAVWLGLLRIPPGAGWHGRPLLIALLAGTASLAWLVMVVRPGRDDWRTAIVLAVQVVCGSAVAALTPGGPEVALPAVGVFDAVAALAPALAVAVTAAGVAALTLAALADHAGTVTVAGYTFALAAALLLGFNRRQYAAHAEQADLLLAQTRLAQQEQARAAALDERARIAREIHDVLAHSLGALAVQLDVAEALLDDGADTATVRGHVSRARTLTVTGLAEARRAVAALRGDSLPLSDLLQELARQYRVESGASATARSTGAEHPLQPDAALAILRTAQEAVSNARKHASGADLDIQLEYGCDATVLTVADRCSSPVPGGTGDLAATGGGYGLTGLRERAELLGGALDAGPDDTGWTVRLRVPVGS